MPPKQSFPQVSCSTHFHFPKALLQNSLLYYVRRRILGRWWLWVLDNPRPAHYFLRKVFSKEGGGGQKWPSECPYKRHHHFPYIYIRRRIFFVPALLTHAPVLPRIYEKLLIITIVIISPCLSLAVSVKPASLNQANGTIRGKESVFFCLLPLCCSFGYSVQSAHNDLAGKKYFFRQPKKSYMHSFIIR